MLKGICYAAPNACLVIISAYDDDDDDDSGCRVLSFGIEVIDEHIIGNDDDDKG